MSEDNDGWIEWAGGRAPVALTDTVKVRRRDKTEVTQVAHICGWIHHDWHDDVMSYRIVQP